MNTKKKSQYETWYMNTKKKNHNMKLGTQPKHITGGSVVGGGEQNLTIQSFWGKKFSCVKLQVGKSIGAKPLKNFHMGTFPHALCS